MSLAPSPRDDAWMELALRFAARHLGATAENPSVGCVLVQGEQLVGTGITALGGRPHAETEAMISAGAQARGATAYVTLEPCAHTGKTPPCAQALIAAGIARVVIGATDPDPRVCGKGAAMLRDAGIAVTLLEHPKARAQLRGFFRRVQHGLPEVTLKIATSADGFMASREARWITGELARAHGHALRATHSAILTGSGTVLFDNPALTCRIAGLENRSPARFILDRRLRTPLKSTLVQTAEKNPTHILTTPEGVELQASHATELREHGAVLHVLEDASLQNILRAIAALGHHRVLVEAGASLSAAFLEAKLVDTLVHYTAPHTLGAQGAAPLSYNPPAEALHAQQILAPDTVSHYKLASCLQG